MVRSWRQYVITYDATHFRTVCYVGVCFRTTAASSFSPLIEGVKSTAQRRAVLQLPSIPYFNEFDVEPPRQRRINLLNNFLIPFFRRLAISFRILSASYTVPRPRRIPLYPTTMRPLRARVKERKSQKPKHNHTDKCETTAKGIM